MTQRQEDNFGQDNTFFHQLPGNLLATTQQWLAKAFWTGDHAKALRQMSKLDLYALGLLLKDEVSRRSALESYMGANFFAPGNKRIVHVGPMIMDDINRWPVNRKGISLEDFSSRASFQMKDVELIPIDSGTPRDLSYIIEPESLVRLVPYSAMHALWLDAMDHEVDHSSVLVELVKRTNKSVKRIFCAQRVLVGLTTGYFCIENLVCMVRKEESSRTTEGDFLLTWK